MGESEDVYVNVQLTSETTLFIPTQDLKEGKYIEGEGVVSDENRKLVLAVNFSDGNSSKSSKIKITCIKL
jgi:hypothetical protein